MAFISQEQYQKDGSFGTREIVECRNCGEDGLIWDNTKSGKNWLFSVVLATDTQKAEYKVDPKSNAFYRMTKNYDLVIVDKRAAHICPAAGQDNPENRFMDGREGDGLSDPDTNEADELMGLVITDET